MEQEDIDFRVTLARRLVKDNSETIEVRRTTDAYNREFLDFLRIVVLPTGSDVLSSTSTWLRMSFLLCTTITPRQIAERMGNVVNDEWLNGAEYIADKQFIMYIVFHGKRCCVTSLGKMFNCCPA